MNASVCSSLESASGAPAGDRDSFNSYMESVPGSLRHGPARARESQALPLLSFVTDRSFVRSRVEQVCNRRRLDGPQLEEPGAVRILVDLLRCLSDRLVDPGDFTGERRIDV